MKKVLSAVVLLGAMCASAESYLYWMVGDTGNFAYDNAQVRVLDNGTATDNYLSLYYADGTAVVGNKVSQEYAAAAQEAELGLYAALGNLLGPNYSYIIELRDAQGGFVAQTGALSYSDALNNIVESGIAVPAGGTGWDPGSGGGSPYNIPEPTSGIMLLLGVAALALRRRRT